MQKFWRCISCCLFCERNNIQKHSVSPGGWSLMTLIMMNTDSVKNSNLCFQWKKELNLICRTLTEHSYPAVCVIVVGWVLKTEYGSAQPHLQYLHHLPLTSQCCNFLRSTIEMSHHVLRFYTAEEAKLGTFSETMTKHIQVFLFHTETHNQVNYLYQLSSHWEQYHRQVYP